jgi:GABA permease
MSRVLVVANETVEAEELLAELRRMGEGEASTFYVCAPAVPVDHGVGTWSQEGAIEAATERLQRTITILRGEGFDVSGAVVGDMVPIPAIADALREFPADRIVISTHPKERSGWLRRDVVEQARKKFGLPVTHVVSHVSDRQHA